MNIPHPWPRFEREDYEPYKPYTCVIDIPSHYTHTLTYSQIAINRIIGVDAETEYKKKCLK